MSEIKHSSLPWHKRPGAKFGDDIIIDTGDLKQPATLGAVLAIINAAKIMSFTTGQQEQQLETEANADLVLTACHNHARLVEENARLREMLARLVRATDGFKGTARDEAQELSASLNAARELIKLANTEKP